ncbi:MFS general substrate transporter [Aspergillus affinis]|uniref:MFS general substrate transporter n=1 Tax=Aspergillus affinis TaxID=1070780 RepID=UPI0022FF405E|nr:MFS general substrate transporter [Aspergillus affinis]KAI9042746.1 MFS general substrate transporter [Aspergillus affinis]
MAGGPLFDRFGAKVIRPAAIVYIFAMMMLSLCKTYWQIILAQGVLMGITMGLLQIPACAAVFQHFDKKRAAAIGVTRIINRWHCFGWSVRIIGFFIIPFMAFAIVTIKACVPPRTTRFWIPEAYKDPKFVLLILSFFFTFMSMSIPIIYFPTYTVTRGMGPTLAGHLSAILNAASTFGRIIPGILADKYGKLNVFTTGAFVTGIIIFCMNYATTNAGLIVYSAVLASLPGASFQELLRPPPSALKTCDIWVRTWEWGHLSALLGD